MMTQVLVSLHKFSYKQILVNKYNHVVAKQIKQNEKQKGEKYTLFKLGVFLCPVVCRSLPETYPYTDIILFTVLATDSYRLSI